MTTPTVHEVVIVGAARTPIGAFLGERFLYLPSLSLSLLAAAVLSECTVESLSLFGGTAIGQQGLSWLRELPEFSRSSAHGMANHKSHSFFSRSLIRTMIVTTSRSMYW